jgi:hypothetical protein
LLLNRKDKRMNIVKPHVSLNVANVDTSVAFYEKVFGTSGGVPCAHQLDPRCAGSTRKEERMLLSIAKEAAR